MLFVIWAIQNNWFPRTWSVSRALATSTDGQLFAVPTGPQERALFTEEMLISAYTQVEVRHVTDGSVYYTFVDREVQQVALSTDEQFLATGNRDNRIRLWHLQDGALLQEFQECTTNVTCGKNALDALVVSPNKDYLAAMGSQMRL